MALFSYVMYLVLEFVHTYDRCHCRVHSVQRRNCATLILAIF